MTRCTLRLAIGLSAATVLVGALAVMLTTATVEEVNISTGEIRVTKTRLGLTMSERVEPTWITRALEAPDAVPEDWRTVNRFGAGRHASPHFRFHGAIAQVTQLRLIEDDSVATPAARRRAAMQLLSIWREQDRYQGAGEFVFRLHQRLMDNLLAGDSPLEADEIPDAG